MSATLALAIKDLRLLSRDVLSLFFTFLFPVVYAVFFGLVFKDVGREIGGRIEVAVVDEDGSTASGELVAELVESREVRVRGPRGDESTDEQHGPLLSTRDEAASALRGGKVVAVIIIPAGFADAEASRFGGQVPLLELVADPSRKAEAGMLRGVLFKMMGQRLQSAFADPRRMRAQIGTARAALADQPDRAGDLGPMLLGFYSALDLFLGQLEARQSAATATQPGAASAAAFRGFDPVEIHTTELSRHRDGPTSAFAVSFPQGIIWGVLGCAAGFSISLVVERRQGTLMRLRLAPITLAHVLAGKALACFVTIVAVGIIMLLFARYGFGVIPRSPGLIPLALLSVAIGFSGIMMLLAVVGRTEQSAGGMSWAILTIMAMLGGGMIPVFFMPGWMQTVSSISPVKWAVLAFEGTLWRGFTLEQMLLPCGILAAIGVASFIVGCGVFARTTTRS